MILTSLSFDWTPLAGDPPGREVVATVLTGAVAYPVLLLVLRASGKRTLAKLNAFDFVVSVALGSLLASTLVGDSTSVAQGVVAAAVLILAQYVIAWTSVRVHLVRRMVRASPIVLVADGQVHRDALGRQRVTEGELRQAIRSAGFGGYDAVGRVVLETDGSLSVIAPSALGDRSALADDDGRSL